MDPSALSEQHQLFIPWVYLASSLVGAFFTLNALRPLARTGRSSIAAFFAGWLTAELPLHHIGWQIMATAGFAWAGALRSWPGWVGLVVTLLSWVALSRLFSRARRTQDLCERALIDVLGADYRNRISSEWLFRVDQAPRLADIARPFTMRRRNVERIRNLSYGVHGARNQLDLYRRGDRPPGCPVLIHVHGGAWISGNKAVQGLPLVYHLASLGWVCVSINYRVSPRATFPDQLVDVKRAIAWVKEHIAEYGGDPKFVVVCGNSAGGHLAALAALVTADAELQPGFEQADTSVVACVPLFGVYDFTNRSTRGRADMIPFLERRVIKRSFAEARDIFDRASPMSRVHASAPPFFVIHGANDVVAPVAEARYFVDLLRRVSHEPVAYLELPDTQHSFSAFNSVRTLHVVRGVARFLAYVHTQHVAARAHTGVAAALRGSAAEA